jgi:hypothetical protein
VSCWTNWPRSGVDIGGVERNWFSHPFAVAQLTSRPVNKLSLDPAPPALAAGPFLPIKGSTPNSVERRAGMS